MRKLLVVSILIFLNGYSFGQVFKGNSTDKKEIYNCLLKINKDSSVLFIYSTESNQIFGEYSGTIKRINESLFHVSATMKFGKEDNPRLYLYDTLTHVLDETDYLKIDTPYVKLTDSIGVEYTNGQVTFFSPYDNEGKIVTFPLDNVLFNKNTCCNYYSIIIKRKNEITEPTLRFKVDYGSTPSFQSEGELELDIEIRNNTFWSTGKPLRETGHFKLKETIK